MNKPVVFGIGFVLGAVAALGTLFGFYAATRKSEARTPKVFADAFLDRVPFEGEWLVVWGGEKRTENRHIGTAPQDRALDLVQLQPGTHQTWAGDRLKNESYACWAKPIVSPVAGTVEIAVDGIPDNVPGKQNSHMVSGNSMMIRSDAGFVLVLCHFKRGSLARKAGDRVQPGDLLGHCGNSGNSSEPHLHMHVQSELGFVRGEALRPLFKTLRVGGTPRENHAPAEKRPPRSALGHVTRCATLLNARRVRAPSSPGASPPTPFETAARNLAPHRVMHLTRSAQTGLRSSRSP